MSDAGTITPETQIKELTEKLEEETDRLLKLYAAYEQQEAELRDTKAEVEVLEKEIVEREIEKESLEALLTEKNWITICDLQLSSCKLETIGIWIICHYSKT
jgi:chromosome segregation ATPase